MFCLRFPIDEDGLNCKELGLSTLCENVIVGIPKTQGYSTGAKRRPT